MRRHVALLAVVLSASSCSTQTSGDRTAEQALAKFGSAVPTLSEVGEYLDAARSDCLSPLVGSQVGLGLCREAQWYLAEQDLAHAEAEYAELIERYGESSFDNDPRPEWHAVHAYAQQRWRESRDAECVLVMLEFTGGSGALIGQVECLAERTRQRAESLRER